MAIIVTLDVMLARRKMRARELAAMVDISEVNLSLIKSGKIKGIRFSTLSKICTALQCQPGDILQWRPGEILDVQAGGVLDVHAGKVLDVQAGVAPDSSRGSSEDVFAKKTG